MHLLVIKETHEAKLADMQLTYPAVGSKLSKQTVITFLLLP